MVASAHLDTNSFYGVFQHFTYHLVFILEGTEFFRWVWCSLVVVYPSACVLSQFVWMNVRRGSITLETVIM